MVIFSSSSIPDDIDAYGTGKSRFENPQLYYAKTASRAPHHVLTFALDLFAADGLSPGLAVDLGCGSGCDTIELLKRGWRVLAVDLEQSACDYIWQRQDLINTHNLTTVVCSIEELKMPTIKLANAGLVLPFCHPSRFPSIWRKIVDAIEVGGCFSGHFFGDRDTWAKDSMQTHHSREGILELFNQFSIEYL